MSEFVDECRQEWHRLGVPDAMANEMAADLTADLQEAESEGVSAEEVLGSAVFDPRAFARSWATERGVVTSPASAGAAPVLTEERPTRTRMLALVAALAAVAIVGVALVARVRHSVEFIGSVRRAVPKPFFGPPADFKLPVFPHPASGSNLTHGVGVLLLLVGVAGLVAATIYWSRRAKPKH